MNNLLTYGQYFGDKDKAVNVRGLQIVKTSYKSNIFIPNHSHKNSYLCFVIKGNYLENYNKKTLSCYKGDLIVHPTEYNHSNKFQKDGTICFNIEFNKDWLTKLDTFNVVLKDLNKINDGIVSGLFLKLYNEFIKYDEFSSLMIEGFIFEIIATLNRLHHSNKTDYKCPQWITKVTDLLHDEFYNDLNLNDIALLVNVHPVYLSRAFKKYKKISIGEYLRKIRIDNACLKLSNTDSPITEIALDCGFSDQSHFTKNFKSQIGLTPLQFKKNF